MADLPKLSDAKVEVLSGAGIAVGVALLFRVAYRMEKRRQLRRDLLRVERQAERLLAELQRRERSAR